MRHTGLVHPRSQHICEPHTQTHRHRHRHRHRQTHTDTDTHTDTHTQTHTHTHTHTHRHTHRETQRDTEIQRHRDTETHRDTHMYDRVGRSDTRNAGSTYVITSATFVREMFLAVWASHSHFRDGTTWGSTKSTGTMSSSSTSISPNNCCARLASGTTCPAGDNSTNAASVAGVGTWGTVPSSSSEKHAHGSGSDGCGVYTGMRGAHGVTVHTLWLWHAHARATRATPATCFGFRHTAVASPPVPNTPDPQQYLCTPSRNGECNVATHKHGTWHAGRTADRGQTQHIRVLCQRIHPQTASPGVVALHIEGRFPRPTPGQQSHRRHQHPHQHQPQRMLHHQGARAPTPKHTHLYPAPPKCVCWVKPHRRSNGEQLCSTRSNGNPQGTCQVTCSQW